MMQMQRDILAGKSTNGFRSINEVRTVPKAFTDWVDANGDRIMRAKALPYFLKDNGKIVDGKWVMKIENTYGTSGQGLSPLNKQQTRKFDSISAPTGVYDSALENFKSAPMEHRLANKGNVNPAYKEDAVGLNNNCAGCVMAYVARRNGYNVIAGIRNNAKFEELASHPEKAWLTKEGEVPKFIIAGGAYTEKGRIVYKNRETMLSEFDTLTQKEGLYQIKYRPPVVGEGHTIIVERLSDKILMIYDGQNAKMYKWRDDNRIISNAEGIGVLSLSGLKFNPEYVNVGLAKQGTR